MVGESARGGDRRAVDAVEALGRSVAGGSSPTPSCVVAPSSSTSIEIAKPPVPPARAQVAQLGATETATGREQRQRLEQIGLAGAVLAPEGDQRAVERKIERGIGAKVPQHQPSHHGAARARRGRARRGIIGDVARRTARRERGAGLPRGAIAVAGGAFSAIAKERRP